MNNFPNHSTSQAHQGFHSLVHKLIAKRDELARYTYFFPTIMQDSPERELFYRITNVLMFRYSITHKSNIIIYRPYTVAFNLSNSFTSK